jgi:hypothetical protein
MHQCRLVDCKCTTLARDVDDGEGYACVRLRDTIRAEPMNVFESLQLNLGSHIRVASRLALIGS